VMGAGAGKRVSAVRWGVAGNIVVAWLLTLPAAAGVGAATYGFSSLFGDGAAGPIVISLLGIAALFYVFTHRLREAPVPASASA
jgi:inorganic phosphate transporter, PiT family